MSELYHASQMPLFPLTKICHSCVPPTEKPIEAFSRDKNTKDGYRYNCKACIHVRHKDKNNERGKRYYVEHIEDRKAYARAVWPSAYIKRREQKLEKQRVRYASDKNYAQYNSNYAKQWAREHPNIVNQRVAKRKAIKTAVTVGEVDYTRILERDGYWCYICEKEITSTHKIEFDHVIPLCRGGSHSEENIKPTHSLCNHRKHARLLSEMTTFQRRGIS